MAFEVGVANQGAVYGAENLPPCRFTDAEWWNILALAHECGLDPAREYVHLVYPAKPGESHELDSRLASGLRIGVGAILNQDTLPFATTWESEDDRFHFRWAVEPGYARDLEPDNSRNTGSYWDFDLDKAELHRLLECLGGGRVAVMRVEDPFTRQSSSGRQPAPE